MTARLAILTLIDGATNAEGHVCALGTLVAWQAELERAGTEIAELRGPLDDAAAERCETARRDLREIVRGAERLRRHLAGAVLR